ncbi:TolC family protein [Croceitalea rosinachiae]|uniref:TolC family protein n=1 Tax=Croceitalea rosinachiae TaxID=3075596 RepID=A0ABU3AA68_9FLAO|nr:TolC family protein [Croceitalea sp. F388]MDT0606795.1 TolC family protein [Croceitalea sp. F388]
MRIKTFSLTTILVVLVQIISAQEKVLSKEEAVKLALENNFGIIIAKNNVEVAENNKNILNSGFLPSITGNAGANYQRDDSTFEFPGQFITDEDGNQVPRPDTDLYKAEAQRYNAGLTANYTLFDGLGRLYDYKRLKEEYNLSELQARETIETTILQLFTVYFEVARLSENIGVLEETFSNTKNRLQRAEYSFEYGQNNKLDVLNAEVDLVNDSINLMNERQTFKNTQRDLNVLLNQELIKVFRVDTTIVFTDPLTLDNYLNEGERNNIRMLQAEKNVMINDYSLKAGKSVFLPTIGLTGSYGWNLNQSAPSAFFPGINTNNTRNFALGANLTWNLFDGGSGITQVKNAKILLDSQDTLQEQIEQEVKRDIANAKGNYENRLEVFRLQEQNVNTATNNYNRSNERYKLGQITSVELRQAQLNLLNAKTSKNLAKYNAKLAELELLQLTGQLLNTNL